MRSRYSAHSKGNPSLDIFENFPRAEGERGLFVLNAGLANPPFHRVADIGGGANPLLDVPTVLEHGLEYSMFDISQVELDKAPAQFRKVRVDVTVPLMEFCARIGTDKYDLICSRDFLEHVRDPIHVHENIHAALRPGGLAVHFYPSPNCLPLFVNRFFPERMTHFLLSIAQPRRDLIGYARKFPAFYAMCGAPSPALEAKYNRLGFHVVRHTGFIGHEYYARFPIAREIEQTLRPVLRRAGLPLISRSILVLRKH